MKDTISVFVKLLLIITSLTFLSGTSGAAPSNPYNQIIFFGDSLTDNGNFYKFTLGITPKSPPYFQGRFSNGVTWAEHIAEHFGSALTYANYAVGGETAILHNIFDGFLPYTLTSSVDDYLFRNVFYDKSHSLFIIWIGANDYLLQKNFDGKLIDNIIGAINDNVEKLIANKATNILLINLPDLSLTPRGRISDTSKILMQYSVVHNQKLAALATTLQNRHPKLTISLYDINGAFHALVTEPSEFNKKYHTNISKTSTGCWTGGYSIEQMQKHKSSIKSELDQQIKFNRIAQNIDTKTLATAMVSMPDLEEAYAVSDSFTNGGTACANPSEYLFWDSIHPSEVAHMIIAQGLIAFINEHHSYK